VDTTTPLWALVSDIFLRVKIEALARTEGRGCRVFATAATLVAALDAGASPPIILVDLGARDEAGFVLLAALAGRSAPAPPTLAYYSHVDEAARQRALAIGVNRIVPRSALVARFGALVREVSAGTSAG
jgi:DNA-binding NarL/FixJ family response regulator